MCHLGKMEAWAGCAARLWSSLTVAGQGCVGDVVGENGMGGASVKGNDIIQLWMPWIRRCTQTQHRPSWGCLAE